MLFAFTAKFFTKEPGTHTNATDAPRTPTALHTHRERRRRGLGPLAANGAAGRRGCGAEGTLLECCDLAEDRFRVPHNRLRGSLEYEPCMDPAFSERLRP